VLFNQSFSFLFHKYLKELAREISLDGNEVHLASLIRDDHLACWCNIFKIKTTYRLQQSPKEEENIQFQNKQGQLAIEDKSFLTSDNGGQLANKKRFYQLTASTLILICTYMELLWLLVQGIPIIN